MAPAVRCGFEPTFADPQREHQDARIARRLSDSPRDFMSVKVR